MVVDTLLVDSEFINLVKVLNILVATKLLEYRALRGSISENRIERFSSTST